MSSHLSTPDKTLNLCVRFLSEWQEQQNFDLVLAEQRKIDNSEVTDIAATTCREYFRQKHYIDWLISKNCEIPPRGRIKRILGIALTQMLMKQIPVEIICDTAVRFCKIKHSKHEANFLNGVLRQLSQGNFPLPKGDIQLGLSPELLLHWRKHFSKETVKKLAENLKNSPPLTARLSPDEPEISDLLPLLEELHLAAWAGKVKMYEVTHAKDFIEKNNNRLYIQDPAPLMAVNLLAPQAGEKIADLCAAPGGKSLLIAQLMKAKGELFVSDISEKRLQVVRQNLVNYPSCKIFQMDARQPTITAGSLDGVLLDVPCSNSGVIRRKPDVRWTFNRKKLQELCELQSEMLRAAAKLIRVGGRLVYSTCSICPEENLELVKSFVEKNENFSIESSMLLLPEKFHDGSFAAKIIKIRE